MQIKALNTTKWIYNNSKKIILPCAAMTLLLILTSLSEVGIALVSKQIVDEATDGIESALMSLLIVYGVVVITQIALGWINSYLNIVLWQKFSIKLRITLYKKIINAIWLDFNKKHYGDYSSRLIQDTSTVCSGIVDDIPGIITSFFKFIAAFSVLVYYEPLIAVLTFAFSPIAFVITRLYSTKLKKNYIKIQEINSEVTSKYHEFFSNIQIIKTFGLEYLTETNLTELYEKRKNISVKNQLLSNSIELVKSLFVWSGYFIGFSIGVVGIARGEISFGVLVVFLQLFNQIQGPLASLAKAIPTIAIVFAAAERLIELDELKQDENNVVIKTSECTKIVFEDVTFSYQGKVDQLEKIYFVANRGELVLIMGKSGSGKTTLIRLMLALMTPKNGNIFVVEDNGNKIQVSPSTRTLISYVPQGNSLFSGTIHSNLLHGKPDATFDDIRKAIRAAEIEEFINELECGLDTVIGERGIGVSEGQAQRIAIARALIKDAPIVIFDEATSSLDEETEKKVMNNIKREYCSKIVIIITHRVSIKEYANRTYLMKDGHLYEE